MTREKISKRANYAHKNQYQIRQFILLVLLNENVENQHMNKFRPLLHLLTPQQNSCCILKQQISNILFLDHLIFHVLNCSKLKSFVRLKDHKRIQPLIYTCIGKVDNIMSPNNWHFLLKKKLLAN